MKLVKLSIISIACCAAGLIVLAFLAVQGYERMRTKQAEIADLIGLESRIDSFSSASDSLVLFGADASLWRAYRNEARAIQERLREMGQDSPAALNAARHMDPILEAILAATRHGDGSSPDPGAGTGESTGPLRIPVRASIIMSQVAGHGIALDTAFDDAISTRQRAIAREATWIAGGFAGTAFLFGVLCIVTFAHIHRRISAPARALAGAIGRLSSGDMTARVRVSGSDELSELARDFNRMIEYRQSLDGELAEQQKELQRQQSMLAESQRMARIGSWRLYLGDNSLEWSEETYRIVGVSPETFRPTPEKFFELVHPCDRERLLHIRDAVLGQQQPKHDCEFRIVRPDGDESYVHERAEVQRDPAGGETVLVGTIQDITDRKRYEERLNQYRQLIEGSEDAYAIGDSEYRYVLVNRAYAAWLGKEPREVEGQSVAGILGDEYFRNEIKPRLDLAFGGEAQIFESTRTFPGIGTRSLLLRYYPVESPNGDIHQVGAVISDITDLRRAEAELDQQRRLLEIAGSTARLGGWSVNLETGMVEWSDVVADIHGKPRGFSPTLEEGIEFYAPEWRDRIRELFTACAEKGEPYDEELQLITARGERLWVRAVGEPVLDDRGNIIRVQGAFQDISGRKKIEEERSRLSERVRVMLESITDAFFSLDREWRFIYMNREAENLLRRPFSELKDKNVWTEFPEAVGTRIESEYRRAMRERVTVSLEEYYPPLEKWFDIRAYPSEDGLSVYFRDSTERNEMLARLREQEETLRASHDELAQVLDTRQALINSLPAHIALLDQHGTILDVNEQWRHFGRENNIADPRLGVGANYIAVCDNATGDCADEAMEVADNLRRLLAGDKETFALEYPCHSPDQLRWFRVMANRLVLGEVAGTAYGAVVMHVDITERKLAEQELNRLVYQDPLTGLPSRNGFVQLLGERLEHWDPEAIVVSLNVRGLHDVNEAHGFEQGDRLLVEIAQRLRACAGGSGIVARQGGDDFVAFLTGPGPSGVKRQVAELAGAFDEPFELGSAQVEIAARFGYTQLGAQRRDVVEILRESSLALSRTRQNEFEHVTAAYTPDLDEQVRDRVQLNHELRRAIKENEFDLHFQPKVELQTGALVSCEALVRWRHPERGLLLPGDFISIAEQSQLITPIGDWVVNEACRSLREWMDAGLPIVRVAVNVSFIQLMLGDLVKTVRAALDAHGVSPSSLSLEITESVFERHSEELLGQMRALHDMGVQLSLDDFGTGYSSLMHLQRYPFDEIKVDRGFVKNVATEQYSHHIVATVLDLAAAIGAEVIAEGINSAAVRDTLLRMGYRLGQGFFYSVPLAAEDFTWLLEQGVELPIRDPARSLNGGAGPAHEQS